MATLPQGYPATPGYRAVLGTRAALVTARAADAAARNHKRGLTVTGVVALAAGAALGGLIGSMDHTVAGLVTATSKTVLSTSQIASRVDPGLVDVVSSDGYQQDTAAGTGMSSPPPARCSPTTT